MANPTHQLTVADLAAAKKYISACAETSKISHVGKLESIAATCIGIVEEIVKADKLKSITERDRELCLIVGKAVAAFGGEVK